MADERISLARAFCCYAAIFWGVRLALQTVFAAGPYLTTWWLRAGYHGLTLFFASFTGIFAWVALR
jgi:hypothetical protein